jgi:hypothetical protein
MLYNGMFTREYRNHNTRLSRLVIISSLSVHSFNDKLCTLDNFSEDIRVHKMYRLATSLSSSRSFSQKYLIMICLECSELGPPLRISAIQLRLS